MMRSHGTAKLRARWTQNIRACIGAIRFCDLSLSGSAWVNAIVFFVCVLCVFLCVCFCVYVYVCVSLLCGSLVGSCGGGDWLPPV
jgi:hypothetical protein